MMFSTASTMPSTEIERRLDSPRECYNSPSSISDVEFNRLSSTMTSETSTVSAETSEFTNCSAGSNVRDAATGDEQDGMRDLPPTSGTVDINEAIAHPISSFRSRKRKVCDAVNAVGKQLVKKAKPSQSKDDDESATDSEEKEVPTGESREEPVDRDSSCGGDEYPAGCVETDGGADVECSGASPRRLNRRTLYIEYWSRTDECKERKWDHLDDIAENYGSAEEHIFATTLKGRTACLEPNMFPYDTPAGIEHWTLWHTKDLNHEQVKQYVENWIDANAPHVESWNYDDNPERSIDIFHVHVYFQVAEGLSVLQGRRMEDLLHELD